jgi:hypothetical protein
MSGFGELAPRMLSKEWSHLNMLLVILSGLDLDPTQSCRSLPHQFLTFNLLRGSRKSLSDSTVYSQWLRT